MNATDPQVLDGTITITPEAPSTPPRWATRAEAATYARCSTRTIDRRIRSGALRAHRSGTQTILVDLNDLDALLRSAPVTPGA